LDFTLQCCDKLIVGYERVDFRANDEFSKQRRGGHADRAAITFESSLAHDPVIKSQLDPDPIATQRIECLMAYVS